VVAVSLILVQDSLPIVSPELWADSLTGLPTRIGSIGAAYLGNFNKYLRDSSEGMPLHAGLLVALVLMFLAARYQVRRLTAAGETFSPAIMVFDHPIGAALTVALLFATSPFWPVPIVLRRTFQVLAFAPMIILLRPVVPVRLAPGLYLLWLLIGIDVVKEAFSGELLVGQVILIIESLGGTAAMIWLLRNLRPALGEAAGSTRLRMLQLGSVFVLLVLASGFAAAAMGYMRFARLMTIGMIAGGMLALTLYVTVRVLIGIADIAFHVWPLRSLRMIQHSQGLLESRIYRFLVWGAVVAWTIRYLNYLGLLEPVLSSAKTILHAKYERGDFSISVGGVLEFFLTVWAGYLLSAFIRFVLREDVYPRIRVAPGKSYALSSLLHYVIITLGFVAGIAVLGINLTKLTVLTGALGVGIGFGLQSVVNNFVSGLILLFERPIQVGDTVEVGDLLGKVRRIGIRASTVHTRQGADIIVPNSQLITEKVTNWTLSDQLRRIDLPVGVNYSAAPREVIKILEAVALAHADILKDPEPQGLFMGFGDSSINFELRAWTDQFDDWPRIRSELASAIYDAVHAAGMAFPFPQREVRLLRDTEAGDSTEAGQQADKRERT
jgi:small-conductance mechanosensitive channel